MNEEDITPMVREKLREDIQPLVQECIQGITELVCKLCEKAIMVGVEIGVNLEKK